MQIFVNERAVASLAPSGRASICSFRAIAIGRYDAPPSSTSTAAAGRAASGRAPRYGCSRISRWAFWQ